MTRSSEPIRPRRLRRLGIPVLVAAIALAACGGDDDDTTSPTNAPVTTAPGGDGPAVTTPPGDTPDTTSPGDPATTAPVATTAPDTPGPTPDDPSVVVAAVLEPGSLDILHQAGAALDQALLDNVYETLVEYDADSGDFVPGLADLPDISDDGLTYTFTLREGVTFHSGEPLTAADVVWSLDQSRAEDGNGFETWSRIESVTASDDSTVVIELSERDAFLLFSLTRGEGAVLQAEATSLENSANGTGPFVFDEWNQGTSISLVRNDNYWGEIPRISGVTFAYYTDENAAYNAFVTGDVDILTAASNELLSQVEGNSDYTIVEGTGDGEFTLGINNAREYLSDVRVRTAIRHAIDKEAVLELLDGFGVQIDGPVPPHDPWFVDVDAPAFDPDAARALLAEAGVPDGYPLNLRWPSFYEGLIPGLAEFVAISLEDVGFDVNLDLIEFNVWTEEVYGGHDYDLTAVIHIEPRDVFNYGNPDYYWNYDNPEVIDLLNSARGAASVEESIDDVKQAVELIAADSPVDWLFLTVGLTASKSNITGYPINNTGARFDAAGIVVN